MRSGQAEWADVPRWIFPAGTLFPCLRANMWPELEAQKQTAK